MRTTDEFIAWVVSEHYGVIGGDLLFVAFVLILAGLLLLAELTWRQWRRREVVRRVRGEY